MGEKREMIKLVTEIAHQCGLTVRVKLDTKFVQERGPYFGTGITGVDSSEDTQPKDMHVGIPTKLMNLAKSPKMDNVRRYAFNYFDYHDIEPTGRNLALWIILHELGHARQFKDGRYTSGTIHKHFKMIKETYGHTLSYDQYAKQPMEKYANDFAKANIEKVIAFVEEEGYTVY